MKYIQGESTITLIGGILILGGLIVWTRYCEIKEIKKLEEENSELDSVNKMYKRRVYIIARFGIIVFLYEILKRVNKAIFL
ncbi:hypothetical protein OIU83_01125 [Flavobacterium sp. LS1R49]|uniref:Uncharacterized protein n=1 Tax=Flavobacterium shii TaxID=2987687 RepID=A0A9X2YT36_9FLAO|nr:hypothetical protein [Flavobacterium shii]MCV9926238.1 hypothetical protein [Flavobacterium shii]